MKWKKKRAVNINTLGQTKRGTTINNLVETKSLGKKD